MTIGTTTIGKLKISRLIIGGNPFSGFSHQDQTVDNKMLHYYSAANIKRELWRAEELGINAHVSRADHHVMRVLMEHWDEGGQIQWLAQTCPELGPTQRGIHNAVRGKAVGCHVHGGRMDWLLANNELQECVDSVKDIRKAGLAAGIAGHDYRVFDWAMESGLDVDYFMCCYYNPTNRGTNPEHVHGAKEYFNAEDREAMVQRIARLPRPVIHYKVLAAGRHDPAEAFAFVAKHLRPQDAVCVGVYSQDKPDMLAEDLRLLREALAKVGKSL